MRLEYAIDYVKVRGKKSRKMFKNSEVSFKQDTTKHYDKKQSFADVSVRKHYSGVHTVTLFMNGLSYQSLEFEVI